LIWQKAALSAAKVIAEVVGAAFLCLLNRPKFIFVVYKATKIEPNRRLER